MKTDKQLVKEYQEKNSRLIRMLNDEREKAEGYEQTLKIHTAYIAILLKRLEATKENGIVISLEDIKEAMGKYEARAMLIEGGGFSLYCEE